MFVLEKLSNLLVLKTDIHWDDISDEEGLARAAGYKNS